MNAEVTEAPLVLPERLSAVQAGQGVFCFQPPPWKKTLHHPSANWVTSPEHTQVSSPER